MPSRRELLGTVGVASLVSLAGCSLLSRVDGYVQLKTVLGIRVVDGRRTHEDVVAVRLSDPPGDGPPELHRLHDEWADRFETPRYPTVDDSLQADLSVAYDEVRYVVGVCSPAWADEDEDIGCYNAETRRGDFNRAQVHDSVRASWTGERVRVHSVDGDWSFEDG